MPGKPLPLACDRKAHPGNAVRQDGPGYQVQHLINQTPMGSMSAELAFSLLRAGGASAPAGTSDVQVLRLAEVALGTSKGQWSQRLRDAARIVPVG